MVVADLTALIALNTALLPNNQQVWVVAENANYYLNKTSTAVIDSPLVVETDAGAGAPGRWIQGVELAEPCTPDDNPFGNCICVPPGDVAQSLLYWDGSDPVWLPPGADGEFLQIDAGLLTWGGVPAASITPGPINTVLWSDGTTAQWTGAPVLATSLGFGATPRATGARLNFQQSAEIAYALDSANVSRTILAWNGTVNQLEVGSASGGYGNLLLRATRWDLRVGSTLYLGGLSGAIFPLVNTMGWDDALTAPLIRHNNTTTTANAFTHRAQGVTSGNNNGGAYQVQGGRRAGSGLRGPVRLQWNADDTTFQTGVEIANVVADNRIVSLAFGANITSTQMPANTGDLVTFVGNAASNPSADAVSGHVYYSDTARPAWRFNGTNFRLNGTSATANTGAGGALPAQVVGYMDVQINGTQRKMPYYAA